jgi:hypothetical protein
LLTSEQPAKPAVAHPPADASGPSKSERTEDAKYPAVSQDDSADVLALCRLVTRILMRILHEHNDHVLQKLFPRQSKDTPQRRNTP